MTILENRAVKKTKVPMTINLEKLEKQAKSAENSFSTLKIVKITLFVL